MIRLETNLDCAHSKPFVIFFLEWQQENAFSRTDDTPIRLYMLSMADDTISGDKLTLI
jgi:hypothetical protein